MEEFDPTLTLSDIVRMFNCTEWQARQFIKKYGVRMKNGVWVIGLRAARHLQLSGEAARFFGRPQEEPTWE